VLEATVTSIILLKSLSEEFEDTKGAIRIRSRFAAVMYVPSWNNRTLFMLYVSHCL